MSNNILLLAGLKRLIAETVNAIPAELRICERLDPHGVIIRNSEIVFAVGKRIDGYTAYKFYEAFVSTMDYINREVKEELIQHLLKDAMYYCSRRMSMIYEWELMEILQKMFYRYQLTVENTKYRAIRLITTFVRPVNEYLTIPFVFDSEEFMNHCFFYLNFEQYIYLLNFICMGGSIQQMYEDRRCAARCNVAVKAKERHGERRSVTASKPYNHLLPQRGKAPTMEMKNKRNTPISNRRI